MTSRTTRMLAATLVCIVVAFVAPSWAQEASDDGLGQVVYSGTCSSCHQPHGQGVPGAFPPLEGHVPDLLAAEGGRDYLVRVILFGVQGEIAAAGQTYNGTMPAWAQRSDEEIAAVANYIATAWDNDTLLGGDFAPMQPDEVAAARAEALTPQQVHDLRQELGLATADPGAGAPAVARDGWFTVGQAERGKGYYEQRCVTCHAQDLRGRIDGPAIVGPGFMAFWGGRNGAELFAFVSNNMPPGQAGVLTDQQYIDVIAYVLQQNGYAAGDVELVPDPAVLQDIVIEPQG